jgi:predicted NBD/HSP70 family sugar kinase
MFIAADVGGTTGRVAAYTGTDSMEPLEVKDFKMTKHSRAQSGNVATDLHNFVSTCRELQEEYGVIDGIGLAAAGKVHRDRSKLVMAGNIGHWVGEPVVKHLSEEFRCVVVLGNDAEAAALAEIQFGVANTNEFGEQNLFAMIWGTGIGGAAVYRTPEGDFVPIPGEPGHIYIEGLFKPVPICGCGKPGHLEAYCGGDNMLNVLHKKHHDELDDVDWQTIYMHMYEGLKTVLRVHPVGLVTFSGGVACKQPWLMDKLEELFDLPENIEFGGPKIRVSAFGESAGTLGALSLLNL